LRLYTGQLLEPPLATPVITRSIRDRPRWISGCAAPSWSFVRWLY